MLGSLVGGLATGTGVGWVAFREPTNHWWLLGPSLLLLSFVAERDSPLLSSPWRVPNLPASGRPWQAVMFGTALGSGLATKISSAGFYGALVLSLAGNVSSIHILAAYAWFGFARALPLVAIALHAGVRDQEPARVLAHVLRRRRWIAHAEAGVLLAAGLWVVSSTHTGGVA